MKYLPNFHPSVTLNFYPTDVKGELSYSDSWCEGSNASIDGVVVDFAAFEVWNHNSTCSTTTFTTGKFGTTKIQITTKIFKKGFIWLKSLDIINLLEVCGVEISVQKKRLKEFRITCRIFFEDAILDAII